MLIGRGKSCEKLSNSRVLIFEREQDWIYVIEQLDKMITFHATTTGVAEGKLARPIVKYKTCVPTSAFEEDQPRKQ